MQSRAPISITLALAAALCLTEASPLDEESVAWADALGAGGGLDSLGGLGGLGGDSNEASDGNEVSAAAAAAAKGHARGPHFDTTSARNVTALMGRTARLHCRIHNLGNRTVSWIRHRDIHLLTVGRATYTSDQRFRSAAAAAGAQPGDWSLHIRFPQARDAGLYECQVGTTPPIGMHVYLEVVEPMTVIMGEPEIFIYKGSTINLTCIVQHSPEPPTNIYWMHNTKEVNYDSPRGGISVITEKGDVTTSHLLIQRARAADSGNYSCRPSNTVSTVIAVHVLDGEHPAAMQHGSQSRLQAIFHLLILCAVVVQITQFAHLVTLKPPILK